MEITVIEVFEDKKIPRGMHGDKLQFAYWIKFKSKLLEGHAYFHAYGYNSNGFSDF